ncbi:bifunctional phosphoribosylaminoimidazolecarboxamide formyltransferase/IMP cyclohydrolase [Accumulibacter sp.]|uniref:bifunctional phosphoribosylaminoimidazolecarboxamide formyltransferase/IMP cyclohydrolase n=1 Tax=Accumulibacter sp. TaxID=2053492 RepID=UPI0025CFE90E|nr:bifunctional phosphoribosylaminoimidazolecarboxamide formyltransferase/IMP cyclohydrolase [Accumulibacter sp.]MCM8611743.1 bifunctional phosphoribosylaminoimidazolecarboxamide formyltransferase/IMP cyclohydrolase [Accumulibacter sp.]MCM8635613.1 bifunctional phosphoribosylaminoimidazolecarboxamide formyltransferase/IMP cyclohydrolase [Accumulibacter sp.]MCM8639212.1 bifunctional phosphoribosylaminoimidazolecarboxamide formyltransferase/IMP cyclohydrolase [Accumulibacter sp.]
MKIRQALLSLSNKNGALEFARGLVAHGVRLLSTGGTARMLRDAGLPVSEVGDYTGFPEMLDGRVKTLHPKVHAGILARRDLPEHMTTLERHGIPPIDLVCVNLYPFRETIAKAGVTLDEAIENIDIGGPAMVRSAAKNYGGVAVVTDPDDYSKLLGEMAANGGALSLETRFSLASKAFVHTARYDSAIANWLTSLDSAGQPQAFPARLQVAFDRVETLRYGENPHQRAAFYRDPAPVAGAIADYRQLQGKELSYNNIADADAAWECVKTFDTPACVIIKHANPCGVAIDASLVTAYEKAFQTDSTSAFGGIIAFNGAVDADVVEAMNTRKHFVEVLLAPAFTAAARALLASKQNLRVLELPLARVHHSWEMKRVGGGLLLQTPDRFNVQAADLKVVSRIAPTAAQIDDLLFAYRVAKFVKSNAIVFCGHGMTLGVGAGQMSRVDSTRIAASKAENAGLDLAGSCVASDAFFPFRDGVDVLAAAGARAVIQPGGSLRDEEVIAAADEHGLAMVFTGARHFRH